MNNRKTHNWLVIKITAIAIIACLQVCALAERPGWQREEVSWRAGGDTRIKAIEYPPEKRPPTAKNRKTRRPEKALIFPPATKRTATLLKSTAETGVVLANAIDSPAVDGFVPWIAVMATDARADASSLTPTDAVTEFLITGNYLTGTPESDYVIGIFDTGASAHVMGNAAAVRAGLFDHVPDLMTSNTITVSGVTGETDVLVSQPIGIFIDGLGAIDSSGLLSDRSKMMGQSNVAIAVGMGEAPVDLPTAIGSPLSVYFTAVFHNDTQITVNRDGNDYNAPDIRIYKQDDTNIPTYANTIPLELRPLGGASVQYIFDPFDFEYTPTSPSVIIGNFSQSIFFVSSVDLYDAAHSAIDKTRFMLDTGAQVSVVGSRIGARLGLNPANPEFEVEIQGVTGDTIMAPGFYLDVIDIPALGDWLSFTNVPVVLLDVPSPEGGTVDGIIGMNLFTDLNFVFRGGGLFLQNDPSVEYEVIYPFAGDIAPPGGDGIVDLLDLAALIQAWLATPASPNWNTQADLVPDGIINFRDFAVIARNWLQQSGSEPLPTGM